MPEPDLLSEAISHAQALFIEGDVAGAQALYQSLWDEAEQHEDRYQACAAAHFMAHAQSDPKTNYTGICAPWQRRKPARMIVSPASIPRSMPMSRRCICGWAMSRKRDGIARTPQPWPTVCPATHMATSFVG
jgi:hypothetical protein